MSRSARPSWLGRVFGLGENPLTWSLPAGRLGSVAVRLHLIFVVIIAVRVTQSLQFEHAGLVFQFASLAGLLLLVLAHEIGHVVFARGAGLTIDRLVLWPLGGLDHGERPERPGQAARVALGGPVVNAALLPLFAGLTLWATGDWDLVLFNPFGYREAALEASAEGVLPWLVWSLHTSNLMLLTFNLLVPMHPLDSGRLLHAAAWAGLGEATAARIAAIVGLAVATMIAGVGLAANEAALLGLGIVGGFVCWQELDRARFLALETADWTPDADPADDAEIVPTTPDGPEIDSILEKISREGMGSLTAEERGVLDRASAAGRDH